MSTLISLTFTIGKVGEILDTEIDILVSLIESFKLIERDNLETIKNQRKREADEFFQLMAIQSGRAIFDMEFNVTMSRIGDFELESNKDILRAIDMLKNYQYFAKQYNIDVSDLNFI